MSEELRLLDRFRPLRKEEENLLYALLGQSRSSLEDELAAALVEDMSDGGMGGIRFKAIDENKRTLGFKCVEAEYVDADGVQVSIVVNLDSEGDLYEVDFWKVDFSPLRCYPRPEQVKIRDQ